MAGRAPHPEAVDWSALLPEAARLLLGEPPRIEAGGATWRYRTHGSLAVHVGGAQRGTWRDFEADVSGAVLGFVQHVTGCDKAGALRWLAEAGLIAPRAESGESGASRPARRETSGHNGPSRRPRAQGGIQAPPEIGGPSLRSPGLHGADVRRTSTTANVAAAIIGAAEPADDTPARAYLARRWTWPPRETGPDLPPSVRWLPAAAVANLPTWPGADKPRRVVLPAEAAGAVVYLLTTPEAPGARCSLLASAVAVSIEAVTGTGERTAPRFRRTFGNRTGAVFEARRHPGGAVFLVEGEADALALVIAGYGGAVRAVGGTAGYREAAATDPERRPVVLVPDANHAGARAVVRLLAGLPGRAVRRAPWPAPATGDAADWLAELVSERAGIREHDGAQDRAAAAAGAWLDLTAAVDRGGDPLHLEAT